jgi:alpha-glucoside transport system substrate-binding protein
MRKKNLFVVALLLVAAFVLAACATGGDTGGDADGDNDGSGEMVNNCPAEWTNVSAELDAACNGEYAGTVVTMSGPFTDEDEVKFNTSVADFEEWTGIDIQYTGSKTFETTISAAVQGGAAPDIADFPQPGLLAGFVRDGEVVDVSTFISDAHLTSNYNQGWLDMGQMPGPDGAITAGVWGRFNAKSQVWYPKQAFDEAGYAIPETWDDLLALSDQIVADGSTPWCVGIGSGDATGWPATDWIEEVMLRTTSLENYDAWSFPQPGQERLPFTSPEVKNAAETLAEIWFNDDYVLGGTAAIATTFFGDSPVPMFNNPPDCWLHKQGNFITSFFPEGLEAGVDYDFFYLPGIDPQYGKPYLVAGDIYAMFNDRPETRATMDFFSRGESVHAWLAAGGALSPHMDASLDWYGDDVERGVAELVSGATSVRFDGSDLMPGAVGAGSFWTGMTDWVSGTADLDTVLEEIDAAWPTE